MGKSRASIYQVRSVGKRLPIIKWKHLVCDCRVCKNMCRVPCWPSPDEAQKLIDLGYGPRMMLNSQYHPKKDHEIFVICPAKIGLEGKTNWSKRDKRGPVRCNFQKKGLCQLHDICKPIEGRLAICEGPEPDNLRDQVALLWDSPKAQNLVREWAKKFAKDQEEMSIHLSN